MTIFVPRESSATEPRVPLIPDTVKRLTGKGTAFTIEAGLGVSVGIADSAYEEAGATVAQDRAAALAEADIVVRLNAPPLEDVRAMKRGTILISYMEPFKAFDLQDACAEAGVTALAMELIPRTTLAQKMDALSSQANLGGYVAVIIAAERLDRVFPLMMTPAGTLAPARVFIIGCGVAGLQAIATAKRLGARVEAFDTRPAVEEQVKSLGAKFVKADLGETGETEGGYARQLTDEQLAKQQEAMAKVVAQSDVVITTAQVFGRPAPRIVTEEMVRSMRPGALIVDMAVETGGNVEGAKLGEEVEVAGVRIVGLGNLPGQVARDASQVYSSNVGALIEHFWDSESKAFQLKFEDEILEGCVVTHDGELRNARLKELRSQA